MIKWTHSNKINLNLKMNRSKFKFLVNPQLLGILLSVLKHPMDAVENILIKCKDSEREKKKNLD